MVIEVVTVTNVTTSVTIENVVNGVCFAVIRHLTARGVAAYDDAVCPLVPVRLACVEGLVEHGGVLQTDVEVLVPNDVRIRVPVYVIIIILVEPVWEGEVLLIPARP